MTISSQPTQRLTVYIGESDRWRGRPLYAVILEALRREGIAGATVLRGVAGFGAHSRIHTASIVRLSEDLPLRIEIVDTRENIQRALTLLSPMVREGLMTLEEVQVLRYTHRALNPLPADVPVRDVMTRRVVTARPNEPLLTAWERMDSEGIKALPVVDDEGRVAGMLTSDDIFRHTGFGVRPTWPDHLELTLVQEEIRRLADTALTVAQVMSAPPVVVTAQTALGQAAALLVSEDIKRLPVVDDDGRLLGILSRVDVLRQVLPAAAEPAPTQGDESLPVRGSVVGEIMRPLPTVPAHAEFSDVLAAMLQAGERRLVVLDAGGLPIGLIGDVDLVARVHPEARRSVLRALFRRSSPPEMGQTAAEMMSPEVLTAFADTPLLAALEHMLRTGRKWLVVVDEAGHPLGLIDRQSLLRALVAA